MFGKIVYISDNVAHVSVPQDAPVIMNLMNMDLKNLIFGLARIVTKERRN